MLGTYGPCWTGPKHKVVSHLEAAGPLDVQIQKSLGAVLSPWRARKEKRSGGSKRRLGIVYKREYRWSVS